jgi:hypothetical protein
MYRRQEVALELNSTGEPCSRTYIADRHGLVITLNAVEFSFVGFVSTWNMNNWPVGSRLDAFLKLHHAIKYAR